MQKGHQYEGAEIASPQKVNVILFRVNDQIEKINKKINEFQKNVFNNATQNNKKKKINYEKNI